MNHYPHHIGDWLRSTAHLSMEEECIYLRLLGLYYSKEAPLPNDIPLLARLIRAKNCELDVRIVVDEFFKIGEDGMLHQSRCDEEIALYQSRADQARTNGKLGGRPRHNPTETDPVNSGIPTGNPTPTENLTNQNQNQNHRKALSRKARETTFPEGFTISDRVKAWALAKGYAASLQNRFEHFCGAAKAKGYTYVDWDEALMTAIRKDWAGLGAAPGPKRVAL